MMFNLFEDNKDIESLVKYLDSKIIELRKFNKLNQNDILFQNINIIYQDNISNWILKYQLPNIELNKRDEEKILNLILDLINVIDNILSK